MSNVSSGNVVTAQKLYHHILDELNNVPELSLQRRNSIIIDILSTLNTVLWGLDEQLAKTLQPYFHYTDLLTMTKREELLEWSDRIFDKLKVTDSHMDSVGSSSLVERAKAYIRENIYTDISQEETANYLYICPSYLRRIFRKQTGEGFLQYVTRMKMEKAMELLKDPQYKTYLGNC